MSAIARWDAFLATIQARHRDVLAAAEVAAKNFIATVAAGGDIAPLSHELMGVANRLQELERKIIDTWHEKVEQTILDEGNGVEVRDREYWKGKALDRALEDQREELEPRIFADLARRRFAHAAGQRSALFCGWCGTQLEPPVAFSTIEVPCRCGQRTPFEPGELMRSVAAIGTHAIAQEAAVIQWRAMKAAERRVKNMRPPHPLDVVVAYERSQITYWRAYLAVRAQLEPTLARDPALEIRSRMEQWYVYNAEFEEEWVAAGRPRSPI
jgi:hypothetical protein